MADEFAQFDQTNPDIVVRPLRFKILRECFSNFLIVMCIFSMNLIICLVWVKFSILISDRLIQLFTGSGWCRGWLHVWSNEQNVQITRWWWAVMGSAFSFNISFVWSFLTFCDCKFVSFGNWLFHSSYIDWRVNFQVNANSIAWESRM